MMMMITALTLLALALVASGSAIPSKGNSVSYADGKESYKNYLQWKKSLPLGSVATFGAYINWVGEGRPEREMTVEGEAEEEEEDQGKPLAKREARSKCKCHEKEEKNEKTEVSRRKQEDALPSEGPAVDGSELFKEYVQWQSKVGPNGDKRFYTFNQWRKKQKNQGKEKRGEFQQSDVGELLESIETRSSSTETEKSEGGEGKGEGGGKGGFDCETRSPCTEENAAKGLFYFAAKTPRNFIQCSSSGSCSTMTCGVGFIWDDDIKTCTIPT